jgi:N-acetylglucosaminyl-diphospho-decaprenol L-rhamnosyltransferase
MHTTKILARAEENDSGNGIPWVRIIVVNYNGAGVLQDCVNALATQTVRDFEVVIVDNGSADNSIIDLEIPDRRFGVEELGTNLGFAAANNRAALGCTAPWIATLNPDTRPSPTWLAELRKATERHPWAQAFGSTQLQAENPDVVDGFGDVFCFWGFAWRGCGGRPVSTLPDGDREVFAPCAAAALYLREAFNAVGGFDESFFCYLEDVDLGFRLRLMGFRCVQVRRAEVLHVGSAISGPVSEFMIFHSYRNRVWLLIKNFPGPLLALMLVVHIPLVLFLLSRPRGFSRRAGVQGIWAGVVGLPQAFSRRIEIQRQRTISSLALAKMMVWDLRKVSGRAPHFLSIDSDRTPAREASSPAPH